MYLKSLILKGFKSFADKSVLNLEPGITAVVGPNGSGKSNISDAVLWVLGERSARNLRGQAMEDIIFSGSAARKAVSVAEVDLVLDNSDQTLPVEFDEVVITRRMYRSGESEYLVNGVAARRLDVLDILHDTGLGTGTHSIISQGSLDSILQSKPEDRRALIEEAAGVLKHKQRKEKSARKLEAMDVHLTRVRDVAGEVKRQLGPLERKAKRAAAYQEASAQLASVALALAVDDLRELQQRWEAIGTAEAELSQEVEERRASVGLAEQKVSEFQEAMKRDSQDATELSRRQRRAANLAERLDGAEMLLRERRRAAVAFEADAAAAQENAKASRIQAETELSQAKEALAQALNSLEGETAKLDEMAAKKSELDKTVHASQGEIDQLNRSLDQVAASLEEAKAHREALQESLAHGMAHVTLAEARRAELATELERARQEEAHAAQVEKEALATLEALEKAAAAAQEETADRFNDKEAAQEAQAQARASLGVAQSQVEAIQAVIRASMEEDPALAWLADNAEEILGSAQPLASTVRAEGALESVVEHLLEEDLAALAVSDRDRARKAVEALMEQGLGGNVSLVVPASSAAKADLSGLSGRPLLSCFDYPAEAAPVVQALWGDVTVFTTAREAFEAWERTPCAGRFVTLDGCMFWPNGKVRVFGPKSDGDDGVLGRERRLEQARRELAQCQEAYGESCKAVEATAASYREAQAKSLELSQQLAQSKGASDSAKDEHERLERRLSSLSMEAADIEQQTQAAKKTVDELRPDLEKTDASIEELGRRRADLAQQREGKVQDIKPLRRELAEVSEASNEARLAAAKLEERKAYAERMVQTRQQQIASLEEDALRFVRERALKRAAALRGQRLLGTFAHLSQGIEQRLDRLNAAMDASESAANSVHADVAQARSEARAAHDSYDEVNGRMAQLRVEKSRLEVQVEAAVNAVVRDCATPLEVAEQLPVLEDRQASEDEKFRLERRIKNMGAINPDAAQEYAELKERYDFLAGQLEDMEAARRSLNRIVHVIDARMKDDFAHTFETVNANFNEIFSVLFPGGAAHLSLTDPDDVENAGVEVTAQPRGKRLTKMMLMSGGEKSLTALALLFAVYKTRTTPFYILDEVEAALDDTNLRRLISYIDTLRATTQVIMITHQRRTMEMADVLFGVSMQADGVTRVISQKLERALEHAHQE